MDKQKVSTLQALERISKDFAVRRRDLSVCGLKDKQGRTEQLVGVMGGALGDSEVVQTGDLRLKRIGFLKHGQGFIARQLIRGDWEGALKAFLATPSELDKSDDAKVKAFWRDHWGEWQLRAPHEAGKRYAPVLRLLREDPRDFKGAFLHIDRRIRAMALFELQSFVWNEGVKRYLAGRIPAPELIGLRYQAGALNFPRALPRELRDELWSKTFPLLAPDSTFDDDRVREAALGALRAQGLSLADLAVPETRQLFFKHEERPLFVVPGKLRMSGPRPDELNRGRSKVNLSFTLPPGAYATLVVRRVLWFAVESRRSDGPVGKPWGQPLTQAQRPRREPPAAAPELAAPKRERVGFLERQRRK